ncbi:glycosyl hydrolase family 16 [Nonlabens ulvanivorans]|uniref:glycosyl hydrolase family 16 n=1 Tax=Nonlabens ulvanivorans TaxID=906888 RepID=UPI0037C97448
MKNSKINFLKVSLLLAVFSLTISCERDLSDDVAAATFSKTGEIFTDTPIGLGSDFYFPYSDSKFTAFSVDNNEGYQSAASIRIDVPNDNDPEGAYAGGIFRIDGAGRDLTEYDALTFWAKASQGVTIGELGFGEDFLENRFVATRTDISIGTNWSKYIVPIPDPSKLTQERGMLRYAAGTQGTGGAGYTLWIDELKFEKLGTIAQPRPSIVNGQDVTASSFTGVTTPVTDLMQTFNIASAGDVSVVAAPAYFEFNSSDTNVATVDASGIISVITSGTSEITATLGENDASGSITINSLGNFILAPTPTRSPANVISIFSDTYTNVPVDFYNGFWEPFQTTLSADFVVNGDNILNYTNFNFVGNQFANPTVDATEKSNLHLNMYIPGSVPAGLDFLISIVDFGPDQVDGGGDDTRQQVFFNSSDFTADTWATLEIPITLTQRNNIGLIIYETVNFSVLPNFYLDNIYFYGEPTSPTTAAAIPSDAASNVISLYSDAYTDVAVDTFRTPWSSTPTVLTDEVVAGDNIKKYTSLGFAGIETISSTVDASAMTHLRIETWSANYSSFAIKLVDLGADNTIGTPDDSEHEITISNPATGQWVSHDIPLTDFTGLLNTSNIGQYIIVAQPFESADVYIDNLYFRN